MRYHKFSTQQSPRHWPPGCLDLAQTSTISKHFVPHLIQTKADVVWLASKLVEKCFSLPDDTFALNSEHTAVLFEPNTDRSRNQENNPALKKSQKHRLLRLWQTETLNHIMTYLRTAKRSNYVLCCGKLLFCLAQAVIIWRKKVCMRVILVWMGNKNYEHEA